MEVGVQFQRRYHVRIQRLLFLIGIIGSIAVLIQFSLFAHKSYVSSLSHATEGSVFVMVERTTLSNCSESTCLDVVQKGVNSSLESEDKGGDKTEREGMERDYGFRSDDDKEMDNSLEIDEDGRPLDKFIFDSNVDLDKSVHNSSSTRKMELETQLGRMVHFKESDKPSKTNPFSTREEIHNLSGSESPSLLSTTIATNNVENLVSRSDNSFGAGRPIINERGIKPTSLSQMTMLLLRGADASKSMVWMWSIKVSV